MNTTMPTTARQAGIAAADTYRLTGRPGTTPCTDRVGTSYRLAWQNGYWTTLSFYSEIERHRLAEEVVDGLIGDEVLPVFDIALAQAPGFPSDRVFYPHPIVGKDWRGEKWDHMLEERWGG